MKVTQDDLDAFIMYNSSWSFDLARGKVELKIEWRREG